MVRFRSMNDTCNMRPVAGIGDFPSCKRQVAHSGMASTVCHLALGLRPGHARREGKGHYAALGFHGGGPDFGGQGLLATWVLVSGYGYSLRTKSEIYHVSTLGDH